VLVGLLGWLVGRHPLGELHLSILLFSNVEYSWKPTENDNEMQMKGTEKG